MGTENNAVVSYTKITNSDKRHAVAIGNFDGVHKGHQKVFTQAKRIANRN